MSLVISWEAIGIIVTILLALFAFMVGIIKWFMDRDQEALQQRFVALDKRLEDQSNAQAARFEILGQTLTGQSEELHRLDKEILKLRGEIVREYVRREDAIREQVVINAKLDALAAKIDNMGLRSMHAD